VALGAKVRLVSAKGSREVAVAKFFVAPKDENTREIALLPNEILTEILVPAGAVAAPLTRCGRKRGWIGLW